MNCFSKPNRVLFPFSPKRRSAHRLDKENLLGCYVKNPQESEELFILLTFEDLNKHVFITSVFFYMQWGACILHIVAERSAAIAFLHFTQREKVPSATFLSPQRVKCCRMIHNTFFQHLFKTQLVVRSLLRRHHLYDSPILYGCLLQDDRYA